MNGRFRVWKNRNYRWVLLATGCSRLADALDSLVFAWLVYQLTGSALLMGAVFAANALPNILLAPWAGWLADRWRKLPLMRLTAAGRAALAASTAVLLATGQLQVWHLFVLTVLSSTFETLGSPAQGALAAHLVAPEDLPSASGLSGSVSSLAQMLGLVAAAALVGPVGMLAALALDAALFALALVCLTRPRVATDAASPAGQVAGSGGELAAGFRVILGSPLMLVVALLAMFLNLLFVPLTVLEAPLVKDVLHGGPEVLAALGLALLSGMFVSGLCVGRLVARWGTWTTLTVGLVVLGLALALVGLVPRLATGPLAQALVIALYVVSGLGLPLANASLSAWCAASIPREVQGRVFAVFGALALAATPLGSAGAGALAEAWSIPGLLMGAGTTAVVVSLATRLLIRRLEETPAV